MESSAGDQLEKPRPLHIEVGWPKRIVPRPSARRLGRPAGFLAEGAGRRHHVAQRVDLSPAVALAALLQAGDHLLHAARAEELAGGLAASEPQAHVGAPEKRRPPVTCCPRAAKIEAMPDHRVFAPDAEVLGRAALLAGILSRLQGYARDGRLKALQDCVLFLQARKLGLTVLTANIDEFDLLLQLVPAGRVLFYRVGDRD